MLEEIRSGRTAQDRKLAICGEAAALAPEDRVETLCILAADSDPAVRERAAGLLGTQPLKIVLAALARPGGAPEMFAYCAAEFSRRPGVADALAQNSSCPIEILRPVIRYLSVPAIQELFEDLDRLSSSPALVVALIACEVINADQRLMLLELQRAEPEPVEASSTNPVLPGQNSMLPEPVSSLQSPAGEPLILMSPEPVPACSP